jgi:hypothetical protein
MKLKGFILFSVALVLSLLAASAASAKRSDVALSGAGSSLVNPLVQQFISRRRLGLRLLADVFVGRLEHRHRRYLGPDCRLRSLAWWGR